MVFAPMSSLVSLGVYPANLKYSYAFVAWNRFNVHNVDRKLVNLLSFRTDN